MWKLHNFHYHNGKGIINLEEQISHGSNSRISKNDCELRAEIYKRHLTDAAGGNISVRVGDKIVMTPTRGRFDLALEVAARQILILDLKGNKLEGEGEISR